MIQQQPCELVLKGVCVLSMCVRVSCVELFVQEPTTPGPGATSCGS